jgi:hypothetical protein
MTTPTKNVIELGTPYKKLQDVMNLSNNYFFVGVTGKGEVAYSVLLDSPKWDDVTKMCTYIDYIKMALVGQYEWLPLEECDD